MDTICRKTNKQTRRTILQAGFSLTAIPIVAKAAQVSEVNHSTNRTLVLLHLSGGNDGLNTVIPYKDPLYYELRPRLSCVAHKAFAIDEQVRLHQSLSALIPVFRNGHLAIVQGVGYPNPDYSHVGSCRIWTTGGMNMPSPGGWWDIVLDRLSIRSDNSTVCVGSRPPTITATTNLAKVSILDDEGVKVSLPVANPIEYRPDYIKRTLTKITHLVKSVRPPKLIFAAVGGFDTHSDQLQIHEQVLRELGDGLAMFLHRLDVCGAADRVILMAWSEFGRRPSENAMGGTDHGTAAPVLILGKKVRGGLYGRMPSLKNMDFGNLVPTIDFRTVYTMLAERWLHCSPLNRPL
ncbi:MAG: DUF1501 domain-containing protein [Planctomycetota bacterium]|jgi:uncharacterized protein (DUF1501 family)